MLNGMLDEMLDGILDGIQFNSIQTFIRAS